MARSEKARSGPGAGGGGAPRGDRGAPSRARRSPTGGPLRGREKAPQMEEGQEGGRLTSGPEVPDPGASGGEYCVAGSQGGQERPAPRGGFAFLRGGLPPPPPDLIQGISHSAVMERALEILGSLHPDKAVFQHRLLGPPEAPGRPSIFVTEEAGQVLASCATWIVYLVAKKHKSLFGRSPMTIPTLEVALQYLQLEYPSLWDPIDSLAN